jgi:hypothetical protein
MLSLIKTDIKNLNDIAPLIDEDVILKYNVRYTETNVSKPNMVNGLSVVNIRVDDGPSSTSSVAMAPVSSQPQTPTERTVGSALNDDDGLMM